VAIAGLTAVAAEAAGDRGNRPIHTVLTAARRPLSIVNSRQGQAVLNAANMAPGEAVSGMVSLQSKGTASAALALFSANLTSPPGPGGGSLAGALQLRIQDQTGGGGTVFSGTLDSLSAVALGGIGKGQRRTYLITASLPAEIGNEYAAASAKVDFVWNATVLNSKLPCAAAFRGGRRGERLIGTIDGDRIRGQGGADVIRSLAGRDCLYGERGKDRLLGGRDDDRLYGGPGDDLLVGESDTDNLYGGNGDDRILTRGTRRDVVHSGPGFDRARVDRFDVVVGCERVARR
jgi:Ca2+-binding RTX toxin-like protein